MVRGKYLRSAAIHGAAVVVDGTPKLGLIYFVSRVTTRRVPLGRVKLGCVVVVAVVVGM